MIAAAFGHSLLMASVLVTAWIGCVLSRGQA